MNSSSSQPVPPSRVLRQLYLTLFLRGRSARGLKKETAPSSVGRKLLLTILLYLLMGLLALMFLNRNVFSLAIFLHGMTFVFLGMFVASSAGEILFNREEGDILLHLPIETKAMLWAKISVLVQVSLWLACAFNFTGFFVGVACDEGGFGFPLIHLVSTALEALFCTASVVLVYQLCLRWFGRERLENLMTLAQVVVATAAVLSGQILPRLTSSITGKLHFDSHTWWIGLLPPAWFAGMDDAIAGSGALSSWILAGIGIAATCGVLFLAFGKLAESYGTGVQALGERSSKLTKARPGGRLAQRIVNAPPLKWWLRDPVERASFLLVLAYATRDRETKLRVYPGLAPMLILPIFFVVRSGDGAGGGWAQAFFTGYLGLLPMIGLNLLRFSQQWQAADVFRYAPIHGPAQLCHGARRAVLVFITLPMLLLSAALIWFMNGFNAHVLLGVPGLLLLPVYALLPCYGGLAVPFSSPSEEAKSAGRGLWMFGAMIASVLLSFVSVAAWSGKWFLQLVIGEALLVAVLYVALNKVVSKTRWKPLD